MTAASTEFRVTHSKLAGWTVRDADGTVIAAWPDTFSAITAAARLILQARSAPQTQTHLAAELARLKGELAQVREQLTQAGVPHLRDGQTLTLSQRITWLTQRLDHEV